MTRFLLAAIGVYCACLNASAQSISPSESSEHCPLTNITFTVTLPRVSSGTFPTVASWTGAPQVVSSNANNPTHTSTTTTFTFVGRFNDANVTQVFRIEYQTPTNANGRYDATFRRVQSLFHSTSCTQNTNQAPITVPICQVMNIPITVPDEQWGNFSEIPVLCFGTISTFEYQLPSGWSIGTNVSTGTNWIAGGNNVTVTSNGTTGDGGAIRFRPRNPCGSGLANGITPGIIPISRPRPTLSFSGPALLCSTATYTASNLPAWVNSRLWEVIPSSLATIANPISASTNITANGNATGDIRFTISGGPACPVSYTYNTQEIIGQSTLGTGTPVVTWPEVFYPTTNCLPPSFNVIYQSSSLNPFTTYEWGYYEGPSTNTTSPYVLVNAGGLYQQAIQIPNTQTINRISVRGVNQCGAGLQNIREFTFDPSCNAGPPVEWRTGGPKKGGGKKGFAILGNVISTTLTLQLPLGDRMQLVTLTDMQGRVVRSERAQGERMDINISELRRGLYLVTLHEAAGRTTLRFVKP